MKISYAITCYNEYEEVQKLIEQLIKGKRAEDEIVVLWDNRGDVQIASYCGELLEELDFHMVEFNNNFADLKNTLNSKCTGDYIFQLDADELINDERFLRYLPDMLEENPEVELYLVPRINTVDGLTQEDIDNWRWNVDEKGYVNFPDYQNRIYKNSPDIKWVGKVHEKIVGFKAYSQLPSQDLFCILHKKSIDRQRKQNEFYNTL